MIDEYCRVFEENNIDFIISPVAIGEKPPRIDDVINQPASKNPVYEYKMDYYTALPNCTGTPAITMPIVYTLLSLISFREETLNPAYEGFPSSFKLQGYFGEDYHLLRIAKGIECLLKESRMWV